MMAVSGQNVAPLTRSVLSDETYLVLRAMLLEHKIAPGERINILSLASGLHVSPTPVREALARLESDGLVVKAAMRGYSASALLSAREFVELSQFRALIEPWNAEQAAKTIDARSAAAIKAEIESAEAILAAGGEEGGYAALTEHDARFHSLIAQIAGNELIIQSLERTHFHLHFLRLYMASRTLGPGLADSAGDVSATFSEYYRAGNGSLALDEHRAIAQAIVEGRAADAADLIREHIESSQRRFEPVVAALAGGR